ncbi:FAD-binding protein [Streptomyces viridosporus]|uniref:FAD-binding protein n=1 Tax=Streptomyces viridosporus TaxID=67581 RepID=UPI0009BE8F45|nr:FAD-binding protein [Streptomyces viridosporus]
MRNSTPTRRSVLGGIAATVVGWSATSQSWALASDPAAAGVAPLPRLDGTLETTPAATAEFAGDFGGMVSHTSWAVLRPGSVQDVVKMVNYARANKLTIAMNGRGGTGTDLESHSCYGQALTDGGISIDARGLSRIIKLNARSAVVEAGVTWAQLTDAALAKGLTPPALTDYLHLSVGGTLSVGGVGATVQTYGLQVDTVRSIDIVTGTGRLLTASKSVRPDLFEAALAGGGQVGIIVRATVDLVPAPEKATVYRLIYRDEETYLADAEKLMAEGRFQGQVGEIMPAQDGSGWWYRLEGVAYWSGTAAPDSGRLLAGLRDDRSLLTVEEFSYRDCVFRTDAAEAWLRENGYWHQPKPWLSLFLPASRAAEFARVVEEELTADDLGAGFLLFYPYPTARLTRPMAVQPDEKVAYLFDLLRFPAPGADVERMLEQNRRLYDIAVSLGAKRYLVGAIPGMTPQDWRAHFGRVWKSLVEAKRCYDPANILTPGQGFFG